MLFINKFNNFKNYMINYRKLKKKSGEKNDRQNYRVSNQQN